MIQFILTYNTIPVYVHPSRFSTDVIHQLNMIHQTAGQVSLKYGCFLSGIWVVWSLPHFLLPNGANLERQDPNHLLLMAPSNEIVFCFGRFDSQKADRCVHFWMYACKYQFHKDIIIYFCLLLCINVIEVCVCLCMRASVCVKMKKWVWEWQWHGLRSFVLFYFSHMTKRPFTG